MTRPRTTPGQQFLALGESVIAQTTLNINAKHHREFAAAVSLDDSELSFPLTYSKSRELLFQLVDRIASTKDQDKQIVWRQFK